MVKNSTKDSSVKAGLSIVEGLRKLAREHETHVDRKLKKVQAILDGLRKREDEYAKQIESFVEDVEAKLDEDIAKERARDVKIRHAPFFAKRDGDDGHGDITREGLAAIEYLTVKFDATCQDHDLDIECERLREIRDLRERGHLTSDRDRLEQIDELFKTYTRVLEEWGGGFVSDTLDEEIEELIEESREGEESVVDVREFVVDNAGPDTSIGDVVKLDTHDQTRDFEEYLAKFSGVA